MICHTTHKFFLSVLAMFSLSFLDTPSFAFNDADVTRLKSTKQCKWCNLQNADLSGEQLSGAELSNTSLTSANLVKSNLSRANLSGAFLMNANLSGANLTDAFLVNANLSNANLSGAELSGADLSGAIWTDGSKCEKKSFGECKQSNLLGESK